MATTEKVVAMSRTSIQALEQAFAESERRSKAVQADIDIEYKRHKAACAALDLQRLTEQNMQAQLKRQMILENGIADAQKDKYTHAPDDLVCIEKWIRKVSDAKQNELSSGGYFIGTTQKLQVSMHKNSSCMPFLVAEDTRWQNVTRRTGRNAKNKPTESLYKFFSVELMPQTVEKMGPTTEEKDALVRCKLRFDLLPGSYYDGHPN